MHVDGETYALEYDQVGSLKAVVAEDETVVKAIQYAPFGTVLWDSNPALRIPLGFAGGLHDPDTNLTRFGWRDYDPDTGRWTALDPIGEAGGDEDWYGYCLDDPVNGIDPLGLWSWGGMIDSIKSWAKSLDFSTSDKGKKGNTSLYSSIMADKRAASGTDTYDEDAGGSLNGEDGDPASAKEWGGGWNNTIGAKQLEQQAAEKVVAEEKAAKQDAATQAMADKKDAELATLTDNPTTQKTEPLGGAKQSIGNPTGAKTEVGTSQRTVDLAKGKNVEKPRSQIPEIISVEQGLKDYAGSLSFYNGKAVDKEEKAQIQKERDAFWTDVESPYTKNDNRTKIGDVGAVKPNSAKDVTSLKAAEKEYASLITNVDSMLTAIPSTQEEKDNWIDSFARLDSKNINEEQKKELMGKAEQYYEQSSYVEQLTKKVLRSLTGTIQNMQQPLRDFVGYTEDTPTRPSTVKNANHAKQQSSWGLGITKEALRSLSKEILEWRGPLRDLLGYEEPEPIHIPPSFTIKRG